ncbi:MAG: hypothetical protein KGZ58_09640 [Ignavibacteriales bacterium]|nr:hypothetical protein [Ignavibacteriales bacterium]
MKHKEKEFDAVKMMRDIRDKLSKRYSLHPELEQKDLERIRKKYNMYPPKASRKAA